MTKKHWLPGLLFLVLLVALPAARGHAQTGRSADLFEGLDSIRLSVTFGGPLDLSGSTAPQLLADDLKRFNLFEVDLKTALDTKLATCGLFVDPNVTDELSVEVFGRREQLNQCTSCYVYLIQVKVLNSKRKTRRGEGEVVSLPPVIGIADEANLERTLIETAVAAVASELRNCSR